MSGAEILLGILLFLLILLLLIFPIWLSLFLGKKYPGRVWLGVLLCFFFVLAGQLYIVKRSPVWIILLILGGIVLRALLPYPGLVWLTLAISSSLIMYYRLLKQEVPSGSAYQGDAGGYTGGGAGGNTGGEAKKDAGGDILGSTGGDFAGDLSVDFKKDTGGKAKKEAGKAAGGEADGDFLGSTGGDFTGDPSVDFKKDTGGD